MLRHSARKTPIHLITDEQAYRDVWASVMGGLSCIFQPFAQANNPELGEEDWILYLDFNTGALTGATLTITGAASAGPLDCESLDCTTPTSGGVSTGSVVCGNVTSSGTVSAPQLFAYTSGFSDEELGGLEQAECPTTARPFEARSCGCWATRAPGSSRSSASSS